MADTVRAALVQTSWTGDKESMIKAHEEYARQAAAQGAKVICFQELFYGPYFCQVQDAAVLRVRRVDPGPDHRALPGARRRARHGDGPADVRAGAARRPLQHRGRGRRRRQLPRQVPQDPHPAGEGLLGEVLLPARQPRLPGVRHRGRPGRRLHLLRPALPGGLAGARAWPARRSCSTRRRPAAACRRTCGSWSSRPARWPTSTSSARSTASASRTSATTTSTARPTSSTRRASSSARSATRTTRS